MLKRSINISTLLLVGCIFISFGLLLIFDLNFTINTSYALFTIGLAVLIPIMIVNFIVSKWNRRSFKLLIQALLLVILGIFCYNRAYIFFSLIPVVVGFYLLVESIVKTISTYVMFQDHLNGRYRKLIMTILYYILSIELIFYPFDHILIFSWIISVYFIAYGCSFLVRGIVEMIPNSWIDWLDAKVQISIPPLFAAILPPHLIQVILNNEDQNYDVVKQNIPCDLEVYVHVAKSGPAQLGHCDLVYRNMVISYGCYDPHVRGLFGTYGDGVVLYAPKNPYFYNCLKRENKVIACFGIALKESEKKALEEAISESFENLTLFDSDMDLKKRGIQPKGACDDYLSRVSTYVENARYYKIKKGKFRTFFVFYTNCVTYMAQFLHAIGFSLWDFSGIISPGAYYDFLNNELKSDKGHVIYRKIYTKKDADLFR